MKKILLGIIIGIVLVLLFGAVLSYLKPATLIEQPKKFGDIRIWVERYPEVMPPVQSDAVSEMLFMAKSGKLFLSIRMRQDGDIVSMSLLNGQGHVCFTVRASEEVGFWEQAIYVGSNDEGIEPEDMFVDIDFDGHFDIRNVFDGSGNKIAMYIYVDGMWKTVSRYNFSRAIGEENVYIFNRQEGWREEKSLK